MKTLYTGGTFDLFHAGHIKMLEEAKSKCDYLIVGLQLDPSIDRPKKNRPTQSIVERYVQVRSCKYIDEVIPYATEQDLIDTRNGLREAHRVFMQPAFDANKSVVSREVKGAIKNALEKVSSGETGSYTTMNRPNTL